jgi:phytoene dehydrogenase-like protein
VTERPLRAIVDTSAIVRFARGGTRSVGVGETIAEINDEHASFGLPVLCVAEAWRVAGDEHADLFRMLTEHEAAVLLGTPDDWQALAAALEIVGRWDTAVAALLAIDGDVCLLSTTPARYAGFGDADFVVEV